LGFVNLHGLCWETGQGVILTGEITPEQYEQIIYKVKPKAKPKKGIGENLTGLLIIPVIGIAGLIAFSLLKRGKKRWEYQ
jgi:hypothetical protein